MGWVRQTPKPFATLTVEENVLAAASVGRRWGGREAFLRTRRLIDRYGLSAVADLPAWQISPAQLARLEVRVLFEELLPRLADIRIDGPIDRLRSNFIAGIKRLPVTVARA